MNTQPTPITDCIVRLFRAGEAHSDGLILTMVELELKLSAICRERDKAREVLREIRDGEVNPEDEADKFLRDHVPSELSKVREERDRLMFSMKEIYNISSFDYDTMPEAARRLYHGIVLEIADKARKHLTSNKI